jgi:hypothetical protein
VQCINLAQDGDKWRAVVNMVMNIGVVWNVGNFLTGWKSISFLKRTELHGIR